MVTGMEGRPKGDEDTKDAAEKARAIPEGNLTTLLGKIHGALFSANCILCEIKIQLNTWGQKEKIPIRPAENETGSIYLSETVNQTWFEADELKQTAKALALKILGCENPDVKELSDQVRELMADPEKELL